MVALMKADPFLAMAASSLLPGWPYAHVLPYCPPSNPTCSVTAGQAEVKKSRIGCMQNRLVRVCGLKSGDTRMGRRKGVVDPSRQKAHGETNLVQEV